MTTRTITLEIEVSEDKHLNVELTINASYGNLGIGPYEYWGIPGNDVQMGWEIDEWFWDESLYTEEENKIIQKYIDDNFDDICNDFFKLVENE